MMPDDNSIELLRKQAIEVDRYLIDHVGQAISIVGVAIEPNEKNTNKWTICVYIDKKNKSTFKKKERDKIKSYFNLPISFKFVNRPMFA